MRNYETTILVRSTAARTDYDGTIALVRGIYESEGASFSEFDKWEERKLAYPIDKRDDGSYHLLSFGANAETLDEVSRVLKIDDNVMRHLATRRPEGGPSGPLPVAVPLSHDAVIDDLAEEDED